MDPNHFISSLENSAKKIKSLLEGVSEEQVKWKPQPEKWSILEVINHLYDEERDDFRKCYEAHEDVVLGIVVGLLHSDKRLVPSVC